MIINKINNSYTIKLPNTQIDVYNPLSLEEIVKKIITKIQKKYKLNNSIHIKFYLNDNYGTIITLKDYKSPFYIEEEKTVKITIHTEMPFLYEIDYFDIKKYKLPKEKIYYYKNKFYLELNNKLSQNKYYPLLELSTLIYEDTYDIIDKAIKI